MASLSDKKVPSSAVPLLIRKVLHSGDSVKIGRKSSCEVLVKSPFVSGTHCKVEVTSSENGTSKKSGDLHFFVSDLSSNGTWLLKDPSNGDCTAKSGGKDCRSAKKLGKTREEFIPGDCILLLAPVHKECMQYRFVVTKKGSECILEQLPVTFKWNRATTEGSKESKYPKETESGSSIVGRKRSISAGGDETTKKHCGSSTSDTR